MGKGKIIITCVLLYTLAWGPAIADEVELPKRVLKNNMTEVYNVLPEPVDSFTGAFTKGKIYGRLRTNLFYYNWDEEDSKQKDNRAFGIGGSLIYKTAPFYGFSATLGLYTTQNPFFKMDKDEVGFVKSGKDTFDRNKIKDGSTYEGHWGMTSLAQVYLEYERVKFNFKIGRQIFESFLTKSNDTKMIPNTFEGISMVNKSLPATTIKAAYFSKQKLRDHTDFHDVIAVDSWDENDDSAKHAGLTKDRLDEEDIDTELVILGVTNKTVKRLKLDTWVTIVPDLVWSFMIEGNYEIPLTNGWSITPGLRYMRQIDEGAGEIGGAALNGSLAGQAGKLNGYNDADNIKGSLYGLRGVLRKGAGSLLLGYTKVADEADLVSPWRGFPTSGYTRSMAQYNWEANTESWMIKVFYDFGKAGIIPGFRAAIDYAVMDYDDTKEKMGGHSKTDRSIVHIDLWEKFARLPNLEVKVRIGLVRADDSSKGTDPSYNEWRFEMNYLF